MNADPYNIQIDIRRIREIETTLSMILNATVKLDNIETAVMCDGSEVLLKIKGRIDVADPLGMTLQ